MPLSGSKYAIYGTNNAIGQALVVCNLVTPKSDARRKRELKPKEGGGERHKSREKKAAAQLCRTG
jgi:hypothetical protein